MLRSLYTAASGLTTQQFNMDTIANNLANANTTGYKKVRAEFQDLFYSSLRMPTNQPGGQHPNRPYDLFVGLGARPSGSQIMMQQGNIQETGNPLDMALSGPGFFMVSRDQAGTELHYTRDGSFKLDVAGDLVTSDGYYLLSASGNTINLPLDARDITIDADGSISYRDLEDEFQEVGRIGIAEFSNPAGLERYGHNLYRITETSGRPQASAGDTAIRQYNLEASNIQVADEIINLITAQRAYELNSKAVQAADEMMGITNNLRR